MLDEQTVRQALAELPNLCRSLAAGEVDGPQRAARTPRVPSSRPPTRLDVLDALDTRRKPLAGNVAPFGMDSPRRGILPSLDQWAVLLEADMYDHSPELPAELPDPPTVDDVCAWLDAHLHWWLGKPEWDEFAAAAIGTSTPGIVGLWRWARMLAGVRDEPVQRCYKDGGCGGVVEHVGAEVWRCRGCGKERSTQSVFEVSLPQAAKLTGVKLRTLQAWAFRHLLEPLNPGEGPRSLHYDLAEVRRVADGQKGRVA